MTYAYSDPNRAFEEHALPDVEVFYVDFYEAYYNRANADHYNEFTVYEPGWYWWLCFPGCLPDSDNFGPFDTEAEALVDAQKESS